MGVNCGPARWAQVSEKNRVSNAFPPPPGAFTEKKP